MMKRVDESQKKVGCRFYRMSVECVGTTSGCKGEREREGERGRREAGECTRVI